MIKTSCCKGLCPDGSRDLATAESSLSVMYFNRSTTGSLTIVFSCLNVKLEIIWLQCHNQELDPFARYIYNTNMGD